MRKEQRLTASSPNASVNTDFPVVAISIENPTASPIYVRLGAPDTPDGSNADRIIPAAESRVIAASGQVFAFALANPASLSLSATQTGGLFTVANIVLLSEGEIIPTFGSASFLSLSTSQLSSGAQSFTPTPQIYDLGPWGGAVLYYRPDPGSGQAELALDVSADAVTWFPLKLYALWPGVPSTVNVPRIMRYLRTSIFSTGITGEPAISGTFYVRGSLSEVTDLRYAPSNTPIIKAIGLGGISAQQFQFFTGGLPAVSIAYIATSPSTSGAQITLEVEASSDLVNWRKVTDRTQAASIGITLYRALGNLDLFIRVSITQNVAGQSAFGSMYVSIPTEADLGYILNTIQQSLGDLGNPNNTNQDIYHELDSIRTIDNAISTNTANISAVDTTYLPSINSILNTNQPYLSNLPNIASDIANIRATDATYLPSINTILNTNEPTIATNTGTTATNTGTTATNTGTTATNTGSLVTNAARGGNALAGTVAFVNPAVWVPIGTIAVNSYIQAINMDFLQDNALPAGSFRMALGSGGVPQLVVYNSQHPATAAGVVTLTKGATVQYVGPHSGGLLASAGLNQLLVNDTGATGTIGFTVSYTS